MQLVLPPRSVPRAARPGAPPARGLSSVGTGPPGRGGAPRGRGGARPALPPFPPSRDKLGCMPGAGAPVCPLTAPGAEGPVSQTGSSGPRALAAAALRVSRVQSSLSAHRGSRLPELGLRGCLAVCPTLKPRVGGLALGRGALPHVLGRVWGPQTQGRPWGEGDGCGRLPSLCLTGPLRPRESEGQ